MNINSVFEIKKSTKPPLLNIARKKTTFLIFILLKLFINPTPYLYLTSLKHSISIKIAIMLSTVISPSLLYQLIANLNEILFLPLLLTFSGFTSIFSFCFSIVQALGSSSLLLDPLINYKSSVLHLS